MLKSHVSCRACGLEADFPGKSYRCPRCQSRRIVVTEYRERMVL